jgi:hypothetical protein
MDMRVQGWGRPGQALVPDMHTPVETAGRLFAVHRGKACCLAADDLAMQWTMADRSLKGHASLVASPERVWSSRRRGS